MSGLEDVTAEGRVVNPGTPRIAYAVSVLKPRYLFFRSVMLDFIAKSS
jgi:hypothetical protein